MPEDIPQSQPISNQKSINWKRMLIVAVTAAVVIGLGLLIFLILQPEPETTSIVINKKATPSAKTSTPSAKKDETADWKTFTDVTRESDPAFSNVRTVNFSFRYPPDFKILQDEGGPLVSNDPARKSGYDTLSTPGTISADAGLAYDKPSPSTEFLLGGKKSLKGIKTYTHNKFKAFIYYLPIVVTKEGKEVEFSFYCQYVSKEGFNADEVCDLMASTFKFLD